MFYRATAFMVFFATTGAAHAQDVTVFAAASLQDGLEAAADDFEALTGTTVVLSFAGSSTIARQIEYGAPADVFLSANVAWVDHLKATGIVADQDVILYLGNELVVVAADPDLQWPADVLNGSGLVSMALVDAVPAGIYGRQALMDAQLWAELSTLVVQADNVRAALRFVERGETSVGIVYATDAMASDVSIIHRFAPDAHDPIVYPLVQLNERPETVAFTDYLLSEQGLRAFVDFGFTPVVNEVAQ